MGDRTAVVGGPDYIIPPPPSLADHTRLVAALLGYMPWVGTGWFITLILEFVVLFPLLMYGFRRLGIGFSLLAAGCITALSYRFTFPVIHYLRLLFLDSAPYGGFGGFFYFWIFSPAHLWHVIGGVVLARLGGYGSRRQLLGAGVVWFALVLASSACAEPSLSRIALIGFADLPLTVLLLALALTGARLCPKAGNFLTWFGLHPWGLFLGQLLVHNVIQSDIVLGLWTPEDSRMLSVSRFLTLWAGATMLVMAGNWLRTVLRLTSLEKGLLGRHRDIAGSVPAAGALGDGESRKDGLS